MQKTKLQNTEAILKIIEKEKSDEKVIVFTNGCFDILHPGHIDYLTKAREMGDLLIIGLNENASIARLKGVDRPINNVVDRITMLSALSCVDYIVTFAEDTPRNLIQELKPDILVKGDDYKIEDIAGTEEVLQYGGKVNLVPLLQGYSTSQFINRIKEL